ncbi:MAG TPA: hypothetical protein VIL97_10705 [Thermoanaerobaculia bacterium]
MNFEVVEDIARRLDGCVVIGAYALAARGYVRQTADLDLMTTDRNALAAATWNELRDGGFRVDVRIGDFDDPLAGVVRLQSPEVSIDVVVAKSKWQKAVIDRAESIAMGESTLRVPKTSDLILLKLFAGGYGDLRDIANLLAIGPRDELLAEVSAALAELPEEMRLRWERLLEEIL